MIKMAKWFFLLFSGMILSCTFIAAFAYADCVTDCLESHGCGVGQESSGSNCAVYQYRCSSDCLDSGPSGRSKIYGAIAYSRKNGAYGYSHGWTNRKQAEKVALKNCRENGKGCKPAVWFYNSCGAVASDGRHVTWGQASTAGAAMQQALEKCNKKWFKGKCEGKVSHCSG
jgi:serine/threonine-protein kinase